MESKCLWVYPRSGVFWFSIQTSKMERTHFLTSPEMTVNLVLLKNYFCLCSFLSLTSHLEMSHNRSTEFTFPLVLKGCVWSHNCAGSTRSLHAAGTFGTKLGASVPCRIRLKMFNSIIFWNLYSLSMVTSRILTLGSLAAWYKSLFWSFALLCVLLKYKATRKPAGGTFLYHILRTNIFDTYFHNCVIAAKLFRLGFF